MTNGGSVLSGGKVMPMTSKSWITIEGHYAREETDAGANPSG
jgi:hypothetical protein